MGVLVGTFLATHYGQKDQMARPWETLPLLLRPFRGARPGLCIVLPFAKPCKGEISTPKGVALRYTTHSEGCSTSQNYTFERGQFTSRSAGKNNVIYCIYNYIET